MSDGFDTQSTDRFCADPAAQRLELGRLAFADARLRVLAERELYLFERAVRALDDDAARRLELRADTVWRDAVALSEEHDIELQTWL